VKRRRLMEDADLPAVDSLDHVLSGRVFKERVSASAEGSKSPAQNQRIGAQ